MIIIFSKNKIKIVYIYLYIITLILYSLISKNLNSKVYLDIYWNTMIPPNFFKR
jgi:hypothetical protein